MLGISISPLQFLGTETNVLRNMAKWLQALDPALNPAHAHAQVPLEDRPPCAPRLTRKRAVSVSEPRVYVASPAEIAK
jgi:hypothetical protein